MGAKSTNSNTTTSNRSMDDVEDGRGDQEDELLSEQQEASSRDLQEADEAMKKLGLAKNDAEWEAELEGELNEYEMVGGEEGDELNEDQIQAMLEAEKCRFLLLQLLCIFLQCQYQFYLYYGFPSQSFILMPMTFPEFISVLWLGERFKTALI